jgi:hypothetical protein
LARRCFEASQRARNPTCDCREPCLTETTKRGPRRRASLQTRHAGIHRSGVRCAERQRDNSHTALALAAGARHGHPQWPGRGGRIPPGFRQQLLVGFEQANPDKSILVFELFADVRDYYICHAHALGVGCAINHSRALQGLLAEAGSAGYLSALEFGAYLIPFRVSVYGRYDH